MYAGSTGGGVWKTTDGGASWFPLTELIPRIGISSLAMDPAAPGTLYAGSGDPLGSVATRGAGIFKTTDAGATWTQLPGTQGPDFYYVNKIAISPLNSSQVYAATETGVWSSGDAGLTWTDTLSFPAYGGTQSLGIDTADGCKWIAGPESGVFTVGSPATGAGRSSVAISAPPNTGTAVRGGSIVVQDRRIAISQAGAAIVSTPNDETRSAQAISALPYVGIEDTRRLTSNAGDPEHTCGSGSDFKTAWWKLTAPASGTLAVSVQAERYDVFGNAGAVLTVYSAAPVAANELGCVKHDRDTASWEFVSLNVPVTKGTDYWIEVSALGNAANDGGFTILATALKP